MRWSPESAVHESGAPAVQDEVGALRKPPDGFFDMAGRFAARQRPLLILLGRALSPRSRIRPAPSPRLRVPLPNPRPLSASEARSVRELRAWIDDLEAAGVGLRLGGRQEGAGQDGERLQSPLGTPASAGEASYRDLAPRGDLEGGGGQRAGRGRVPTLVVGSKADAGEVKGREGLQRLLPRRLWKAPLVVTVRDALSAPSGERSSLGFVGGHGTSLVRGTERAREGCVVGE